MAKPTTAPGSKLLVQVETVPGTFAAPCGLTTKGIDFAAETSDVTVPDCDNPDLPAWVERAVRSLSGTIKGSGILAMEALPAWRGFLFGGVAKNCRVKLDMPLASNGGHFAGRFIMTKMEVSGEIGDKVRLGSVELVSDGEVTWVAASA